MSFKALTLEDQSTFRAAEKKSPMVLADTIFTNLFIWRSYYRPTWAEAHGCLCLVAAPEGEEPFVLPPVGGGDQLAALDFTLEHLKSKTARPLIKRVPEHLAQKIQAAGWPYVCEHDRDNDDYIYLRSQLCCLSGRKMHQKKNHYNYFINHYNYDCLPVTSELMPELMAVQESWLATKEERNVSSNQLQHEIESVHELLNNFEELGQQGLAVRIDGRIMGFTIGEALSPDTMLVHLEKADYEIRGLFVALSSYFCRQFPPDIVYVNREQDLGLEGLRRSKESLKPDHMRQKYIAAPK